MPPSSSPLAPLTHDDPVHLGEHRLLARLGSGGMGTVYLARSAAGRTVALKTVHTRIAADAAFRTRFRLESDAARVIGDRYGARVFGADPLAPTPWLATEYVIGPQLDEAVRLGGPLPEASIRSLGADLARALGQLHRSDVVHRDLKPSNVMVTAAGPKVIDFGIARVLGDERLTGTGAAAGTPAFMSPEQAGGLDHTPAGDVFALAGVLVFAATGHGPFGGGRAADLLYRVRYAEPDLDGVPAGLAPLLARCLSKDPSLRPGTDELAELLSPGGAADFADGLPQPVLADIARRAAAVWQAPPPRLAAPTEEPGTAVEARTGMSRRRFLALSGGAVAAGTALAAGGGWWAWRSSRPDRATKKNPVLQPPPEPLWWVGAAIPLALPEPLFVGDDLVAAMGITVAAVDARTGASSMDFAGYADRWRVGTDGKVLYGLGKRGTATAPDKAVAVSVLPLQYVEPGEEAPPRVRLSAYDGTHPLTQILGVSGDTVFLHAKSAGAEQWSVVAAGLTSGKERWRVPAAGPTAHQVKLEQPALVRLKSVRGGVLLWQRAEVGDDLRVSLHDAANGTERWSATLEARGATPDQPATDDDHVYLGAATVQALRLSDGKPAWSFGEGRDVGPVVGERRYGIPTVRDGVVYAVEGTHGIVALDARTGTERWREATPKKPAAESTPHRDVAPVATPHHVYTLDALGVRALDLRTRRPVWRYEAKAATLTADPSGTRLHVREQSRMTALPTD
ncbi:protein kinase domain-containing protein [Streptomyces sp. WM6372]|uniref:serine/threonine-protein kinase n=1 Tax=Streptomyces sp. WM6372 TaxID=1415555 RepID=UPI0006B02FE2|nr:serine/threonine-protein kinase [Streptomyces sp. WM6372]